MREVYQPTSPSIYGSRPNFRATETFRLYRKASYEGYNDYGYTATNLLCVTYGVSFQ